MLIPIDAICAKCGHTFHEHGWNIPVEQSELDDHTDCKAMVGWYCHTCKTLLKAAKVYIVKDGIIGEYKWTCPNCGDIVYNSQCECFNFELKR